ncbi:MAG: efflux RND transporter periplasmic adaptor subunit [Bradymonadaceae bacterium]
MSIEEVVPRNYKKLIGTFVVVALIIAVAFAIGRATSGEAAVTHDPHAGHDHGDEPEANIEYVCPMHPQIRQSEPGTCPICHMDLVPVEAGSGGDDDVPNVSFSKAARALGGVRTARAEAIALTREIDVFGRVEMNETSEVDLTAWAGGRIERLLVNSTGERVRRGQLLARIYSPDLLVAQQTLVQASRNLVEAQAAGSEVRARAARSAMEAARTELRLLGVDSRQIDAVLEDGKAKETLDIFATASGTVRARHVSEGDYVQTGGRIVSLVALDSLWVQLEIFERDLPFVTTGTPVRIRVPAIGDEEFEGRVSFIDPVLDERKRVARARVVVANDSGRLRPGMFLRATIDAAFEEGDGEDLPVSVPASAVLWTGKRSMIYRLDSSFDPPAFVPVMVELGPRMGDRYVVREGLEAGDEVAESGAFRLDASLQIKGGPTMMTGMVSSEPKVRLEDLPDVEVPAEGVEFDPPVQPEQLPDFVWYCDMGTVHWAQGDEKDRTCPLCNMTLKHKHDELHEHEEEAQ